MKHYPIGMILSAGYGTRLSPLTDVWPKPIMEIAGQPIIYFLINTLENAGIKDIIINLHHHPDQLKKALEKRRFSARLHLIHERQILGTAGGIANAVKDFDIKNRQLVVMHGDIFCPLNLSSFLDTNEFCTLICDQDREISGYQGSVGIDQEGSIRELGSFFRADDGPKITARGFFTGIHILSSSSLELIKETTHQSLVAQVYPQWLRAGLTIRGIVLPLFYEDLGSPKRLFETNMAIFCDPGRFGLSHLKTQETSPIYINDDAKIHPSAQLCGPLLLMNNVVVEEKAVVGPRAIIGAGVTVKAGAVVKNSIIMSTTVVKKDQCIDGEIVLKDVHVQVS